MPMKNIIQNSFYVCVCVYLHFPFFLCYEIMPTAIYVMCTCKVWYGKQGINNGNVYSYGILLFEMFTGKRPIDDIFHDSLNLRDFVKANLPERIIDIIDPILLPKRQEGKRRMNDT